MRFHRRDRRPAARSAVRERSDGPLVGLALSASPAGTRLVQTTRVLAVDTTDQVIVFGAYRRDRAAGLLLRDGASVRLRPKTFMLLEHLALRPGQLVSKAELLDAVWPAPHGPPSVLAGWVRVPQRAPR